MRRFTVPVFMQIGVRNALVAAEISGVLQLLGRVWGRNDWEVGGSRQETVWLFASWERERSGLEG
jgi:hypothetical protein